MNPSAVGLLLIISGALAIIDPSSLLKGLPSFQNFTKFRLRYLEVTKDYPYGWKDFDCETSLKESDIKDVHHLRPTDIRVIAAVGDSLTAGREALSTSAAEFGTEYRGVSFDAGGDDSLSKRTTLPNILRKFSPNVTGASSGRRKSPLPQSLIGDDFNVAVSGSTSENLDEQVVELERRLRASKTVDYNNDWKLVTVFIGSNDLCKVTTNRTIFSPDAFHQRVKEAVETIRDRIPRSFVNLMPPFNVFSINETHPTAEFCTQFHSVSCPSLFNLSSTEAQSIFDSYLSSLSSIVEELNSPSFAVTLNPALNLAKLPQLWDTPNFAFLAIDCFHFSAFTHDVAAKLVWENLFSSEKERVNAHNFGSLSLDKVKCPPLNCPYLHTNFTRCTITKPAPRVSSVEIKVIEGRGTFSPVLLVMAVGCGLSLLVASTVLITTGIKRRLTRNPTERTPLLTAHYYDEHIF